MYYIGLDVGGTTFKAGVVTEDGRIVHKDAMPTGIERPYQEIIADMAALCKKVAADAGIAMSEIKSIGVGVPGLFDNRTGIVAEMKKHLDTPVFGDNDATVAGLAESVAGVSAGIKDCVFLTLGTGVGGGIIIDGKPYSGAHGCGSEIGHMMIRMGGEQCTCGNFGCFERYASATAIIREARKAVAEHPESSMMAACGGDPERINAKIVIDAAKAGDATAKTVFDGYVYGLAVGIINIINMIDPEVIVLGGGVSAAGEFLLDAVREAVKPMVFFKTMPYARIELAQLGNDAGIIGAAMLGRQ